MNVALLQMRLLLPSRTLKEKRAIVKSVLARARNRFNVSCIEAGLNDQPEDAELAFVTVADSATAISCRSWTSGSLTSARISRWWMCRSRNCETASCRPSRLVCRGAICLLHTYRKMC